MEQIITLLGNNTTVAVLAIPFIMMFLYKITAIFGAIKKRLASVLSYGINVTPDDPLHRYIFSWLADQKYIRAKIFKVRMPWIPSDELKEKDVSYEPIDGTYFCKIKGLPLFSVNSRIEANGNALHKMADLKIYTLSRKRVEALVDNIIEHDKKAKQNKTGEIYTPGGSDWWSQVAPLDTEFFKNQFVTKSAQAIFDNIEKFLGSKDDYYRKNMKYRKGFLFNGIPGSGKSTLAGQIAARYGFDIYIMPGAALFNSGKLLACVPAGSLVVFEDFDLANLTKRSLPKEDDDEPKGKTADSIGGLLTTNATSELLNALDGLVSMKGSILIATTNNVDSLDGALLRPGRFDTHVEMNGIEVDEQERFIARFYDKEKVSLPTDTKSLAIADLAAKCADNIDNFDKLIETLTRE